MSVKFSTPIAERGDYSLEVESPQGTVKCDFNIGEAESFGALGCDKRVGIELGWGAGRLYGFWVNATPKRMALTLTSGGKVLVRSEFGLRYRTIQPNGEGCDPICRAAEATVPF